MDKQGGRSLYFLLRLYLSLYLPRTDHLSLFFCLPIYLSFTPSLSICLSLSLSCTTPTGAPGDNVLYDAAASSSVCLSSLLTLSLAHRWHRPRPLPLPPSLLTNAVCFRNFCCMLRYFLFCLKILSLFMQSARFHPSASPQSACPPVLQSARANNVTTRPRCQTQTSLRPRPRPRPRAARSETTLATLESTFTSTSQFFIPSPSWAKAHSLLVLCFSYNLRLALSFCPEFVSCTQLPAASVSCVLCHNACNRRLYIIHAHALRPSFRPSPCPSVCTLFPASFRFIASWSSSSGRSRRSR